TPGATPEELPRHFAGRCLLRIQLDLQRWSGPCGRVLEPRAEKAVGHPRQTAAPSWDTCASGVGAHRRVVPRRGRGERALGAAAKANAPKQNSADIDGVEVLDERNLGEVADGQGDWLFLGQLDGVDQLRR